MTEQASDWRHSNIFVRPKKLNPFNTASRGGFVLIMIVIILVAVIVRNKRQQAGARSHDLPASRAESRHVQMNNMPTATVMGGMNDNPMNKPMGMDKQASQVSGRKMPTATVI